MTNVLVRPVPRARGIFWRLLLLIPAVAMLAYGAYRHYNVAPGGTINALKLRTKDGLVGQASEAVSNVNPSNPDLYLRLYGPDGKKELWPEKMQELVKKDTPVGNGLTWDLPATMPMEDLGRVDIWDHHAITKDKQLDRVTIAGWDTEGQRYRVELIGEKNKAPEWALPLAAAGGALTLGVLGKFVWDQVV